MSFWHTRAGEPVTILELLGSGGQGEVYRARVQGADVALKLYHDGTASEQRRLIEFLLQIGPPGESFLWPVELVENGGGVGFGYTMPLRPKHFVSVSTLLGRPAEEQPSLKEALTIGYHLADSFLHLHAKRLCYRDINMGNVFVDPTTGAVRICDTDNVDYDGARLGGVLGTQDFMAPEIIRGEADPSAKTDRYSLAVLLFYLLMVGHPLAGAREAAIHCLDAEAKNRLFGYEPVFIFDPANASNRPVVGIHDSPRDRYPIYPPRIRRLFERAFTEGLSSPTKRVTESVWRRELLRARATFFHCECEAEMFDIEPCGTECWCCHTTSAPPVRLGVEDRWLALEEGTVVLTHDLTEHFQLEQVLGRVTRTRDGRLSLTNAGDEHWTFTGSDGARRRIQPGDRVDLDAPGHLEVGRTAALVLPRGVPAPDAVPGRSLHDGNPRRDR